MCLSLFTVFSSLCSVRSVMHRYLEKKNEVNFDKIFNQMLGEYLHNLSSGNQDGQESRTKEYLLMHGCGELVY
jgi:hypothetical protein